MRITVLSIGKTKESYLKDGLKLYLTKLGRYTTLTWTELEDVKNAASLPVNELKRREASLFLEKIKPGEYVVLLDEAGKELSSPELARVIENYMNRSVSQLTFLIGGAFGFDESIVKQASQKIALSRLTFTHQMVRLILAEQLYRAFTILSNEKYHH